jgi:hypothetical protein
MYPPIPDQTAGTQLPVFQDNFGVLHISNFYPWYNQSTGSCTNNYVHLGSNEKITDAMMKSRNFDREKEKFKSLRFASTIKSYFRNRLFRMV